MLPLDDVYIFNRDHVRQVNGQWMVGIHRETRHNTGLLIVALFIFTLGWSIPTILMEPFTLGLLRLSGDVGEAQIVEREAGRNGILQPFTYGRLTFRHVDSDGTARSWTQPVTRGTFERLELGAVVSIRHTDTFARLTGNDADDAMTNNTLVLFWVTAFLVVVVWYIVIRPRLRRRKLERQGQIIRGAMIAYNRISGADPKATVQYRFTSPSGRQIVKTEERVPDNVEHNRVKPSSGTPVAVLYVDDHLFHVL